MNSNQLNMEINSDLLKTDSFEDYSDMRIENIQEDEGVNRSDSFREESTREPSQATEPDKQTTPNDTITRIIMSKITDDYKYIGEFLNGKKDGFGICYYTIGNIYIGEWRENFKEGWGKFKKKDVTFQGEIRKNLFSGYCEKITDKETVCGYCLNGIFVGQIVKSTKKYTIEMSIGDKIYKEIKGDSQFYIGEEHLGLHYNEGRTLIGFLNKKNLNGYGEIYYKDGSKFFGNFTNHRRNGFGIILSKDGKTYTMGYFMDEVKNGPFFVVTANSFKIELYHYGFKTKSVDKYETCKNYLKLNYPEYFYMFRIDYKHLMNVFKPENL